MANNTTVNAAAENAQAAQVADEMLNRKSMKQTFANFANVGSKVFSTVVESAKDLSNMSDEEVRTALHNTFHKAEKEVLAEIAFLNGIPAYRNGRTVKSLEAGLKELMALEKEILALGNVNIIRKVMLMFWTGAKFICGLIAKSIISAAKFIGVYGVRVIAIGLDFVIKVVKKVGGFLKSAWQTVKAIKISSSKNTDEQDEVFEEEVIDDSEEK